MAVGGKRKVFPQCVFANVDDSGRPIFWNAAINRHVIIPSVVLVFIRDHVTAEGALLDEAISSFAYENGLIGRELDSFRNLVGQALDCGMLAEARPEALEPECVDDLPTMLIGCPRSGTTLLSNFLNSHPRITALHEPNLIGEALRLLDGSENYPIYDEWPFTDDRDASADELRIIGDFVKEIYSQIVRSQGKQRWIDKSLYLWEHLEIVDQMFSGNAKYIVAVRHGFDVAQSLTKGLASIPAGYIKKSGLLLEQGLWFWIDQNSKALSFQEKNPERCKIVKYESLVEEPRRTVLDIFDFLGESGPEIVFSGKARPSLSMAGDPRAHQSGTTISRTKTKRWQEWPPELVAHLAEIANPTLARLGYDTIDAG